MSNRRYNDLFRKYPWLRQSSIWRKSKMGKYWKRKLHKARRRWIRAHLRSYRAKEPTYYESVVNWRAS